MVSRTVMAAALLLAALSVTGCAGFMRFGEHEATYRGVVLDHPTGKPVPRAKIIGRASRRGKLSPSMDGLFTRQYVSVDTRTDDAGRFSITIDGKGHRLKIIHGNYNHHRIYYLTREGYPSGKPRSWKVGSGTPYLDASDPNNVTVRIVPMEDEEPPVDKPPNP